MFDIAALVAALKEATPSPTPPQPEMTQSLLAITQSLAAISQRLDASGKRLRSPSPSPSRYSSPLSKRPHRHEESVSPARTRLGGSFPASSPGQSSDQSEDEEEEHHAEEEAFDPCGISPVEARSALDHELLGTSQDDPTDPVDVPVVSTSTAPVASVYSRLGPPRDGSGDHTVPPHPDLTRSWRESWEAQDFKFSRPLEFVPIIHALSKVLKFSPPPTDSPPAEELEYCVFAKASARSVEAPALWSRDQVAKKACGQGRRTRFFPLVEEDET